MSLFTKKTIFSFVILLYISALLYSETPEKRMFSGAINNKYKIGMEFLITGVESASGTYYYETVKQFIDLTGIINEKNNQIELRELDRDKNQTGLFNGIFVSKSRIEGTWSKPDGTKTMPFYLDEIKPSDYIDLSGYWNKADNEGLDFSIDIIQSGMVINGYHTGMTSDASRIDAIMIEDGGPPSIIGTIQDKTVKGIFSSGYSDAKGEFLITIKSEKEIIWKITKITDGEVFIPYDAVLKWKK